MKCDAGEIACAIDRLTETMGGTPTHDVFDWVTRLVVPLFLGLVTLVVACISLKVAVDSNRLTAAVRRDSAESRDRQHRQEAADAMLAFMDTLNAATMAGADADAAPRYADDYSDLMARAATFPKRKAIDLVQHVDRLFSPGELAAQVAEGMNRSAAIGVNNVRARFVIRSWVASGDYEPLNDLRLHDGEWRVYAERRDGDEQLFDLGT
ncbi:hypothetical protein [Frondihabitans sp. VKM Ac-2883]|uniref:hypothetical protein n=1 Tax=Frondihabitans sp. VKM Ac-2883 TaxID=2783823 RepID=UPI00188BC6C8|nr:hypothetical protein [Frondihabitans sp. VKM Ac-2883]MBF4574699.1 hypothetical protein [Frondihabitans sp. VKM Ac-2883]